MREPLKPIINLNFVDKDKLLVDDSNRYFIVNKIYCDRHEASLTLIELNEHFTVWGMNLPIACNKDMFFISERDKDFKFKFWEVDITKMNLTHHIKTLLNEINI